MAGQSLPLGQINPAAQPVQDFIRPLQRQLATPAGPPGMPAPSGISTLQSAGRASISGSNRFQDLAEALAPFNRVLTSSLQTGAEGAAAWASQRGEQQAYALNAKNQALAALGTADRTNEAGSFDYAQANRDLAKRDPEGGLLMDLLNPYRETGVRRGLSKLAASEAEAGLTLAYESFDPQEFGRADRGMGALLKLRSNYTAELAQRYGLDASTPGFINYTLPKINAAWEKVLTRASSDRKEMLKATLPKLAGAEVRSLFAETQAQVQAGNPVIVINGQQVPADNLDLVRGVLWQNATKVLDGYGAKMGLPGEVMGLSKTVIADLYADAAMQDNPAFRMFVQGIEVGPTTTDPVTGKASRFRAGELFPTEDYDAQIKYGEHAYKLRERQEEQVFDTFQSKLTADLLKVGAEDYAGRKLVADQAINDFIKQNPDAPLAPALKAVKDLVGVVGDFQSSGFAPDAGNDVLSSMRERYGTSWDPVAARQEAQGMLPTIAPKDRARFLADVESIIRQKEGGTSTPHRGMVTKAVEAAKASALAREYGGTDREALIRGIPGALESRATNMREAARRFNQAVYPYVNQQLDLEAARLKRPLTEAETAAVASRAVQEYGTKSEQGKADYKSLFPGGSESGAPAVKGTAAQPPAPTPSDPAKPAAKPAPPTFGADRLDNFPNRTQRLRNYQNETILSRPGIDSEMRRVMSGQSFSPQLKRAAMDARAKTPAEFLQQQAARYGIEITDEVMRDLNKRSNAEVSPQRYMAGLLNSGGQALARIGGWALDIATGSQPARAGEMPQQAMARPQPQAPRPQARPQAQAPAPAPARPSGPPPAAPLLPAPVRPQALPTEPFQPQPGRLPARELFPVAGRQGNPQVGQISMVQRQPQSFMGGDDFGAGPGGPVERVTSVSYEGPGGQGGLDVFFESKRFPAVLPGVVKEVGWEGGYGNFVVVESTDPKTGDKVDVLYAHLGTSRGQGINVREGQRLDAGSILGMQGSTGNVQSADGTIASIDFLTPAPKGSGSMTKYGRVQELRREIGEGLQQGRLVSGNRRQRMATRDAGAMVGDVTYYTGSGGSDGVLGGRTANGEVFTGKGMTAAVQWGLKPTHMNKWLIVEDVETGRSIRVWANDTGQMGGTAKRPADRLVDLSPVAFKQLYGSTGRGVGRVRVRIDSNQSGRP